MIGDGYFQLREQIGTSLYALARLAREMGAPETALTGLQDLQAALREPFTFLTLGPTGAGKSALLNALFGREFAGEASLAGQTAIFRHGAEALDAPIDDEHVLAERPHIFLRDFSVVDTPGLEPAAAVPGILRRQLSTADLVLAIFAAKGEGAAAWDFLARMEGESLRRFVFVVSQCDLASPDELPLLVKRVRHTMLTRLSMACPIFPVSAQTRAGMEKLERYIDEQVIAAPAQCQKLAALCTAAQRLLAEVSAQPRRELEAVERASEEHREQRLALQDRKDESLRQIASEHWALAQAFDAAERRGIDILERRLSSASLLRGSRAWEEAFQREVDLRLRDAVARQLETTFEHTNGDLQEALDGHRQVLEKLGVADPLDLPVDRTALLEVFTHALEARDRAGALLSPTALHYARARALFRLPAAAVGVAAVLLLGSLAAPRFFSAAAAFFLLALCAAVLLSFFLRRGLAQRLSRQVAQQRETVIGGFEMGVRDELDRFYEVLAATLLPLEETARERRAQLAPSVGRVDQLHAHFAECIAALEARPPSFPAAVAAVGPVR